jgi:hypothetical protein
LISSFTSWIIRSLSYGANLLFGSLAWWPANSPNDRKIYNYQNKNYQNNQHTHTHTPDSPPSVLKKHDLLLTYRWWSCPTSWSWFVNHITPYRSLARSYARARVNFSLNPTPLLLLCFSTSITIQG